MRRVAVNSKVVVRLWRLLLERPGRYTAGELATELGLTRAAVKRALLQLEEEHLIIIQEE